MADTTAIEWADATFNPWIGCTRVSPACDNCYAATSTPARTRGMKWVTGEPRQRTTVSNWYQPIKWHKKALKTGIRPKVFCASLADVFDTEVDLSWRIDLFQLILITPMLDWLLLTKRPAVAKKWFTSEVRSHIPEKLTSHWDNVWLGTTVENQEMVDVRIPHLMQTPNVEKRFLSVEPLLEAVNLKLDYYLTELPSSAKGIDWVIVGGESGPNFRPIQTEWIEDIGFECMNMDVAFFVKQMSGNTKAALQDIPANLIVREFP